MNQELSLDMYMTAGIGVAALMLGFFFTKKIAVLKRLCIPAPVSGGLLFSLVFFGLHSFWGLDFKFDETIKNILMMLFFTNVGFQSNLKVFKKGGRALLIMLVLVTVLIIVQNLLSMGIAVGLGESPYLGMATGSIPMSGGHGTAAGFTSLFQGFGLTGASSIMMAAATFGLVAGSLIGGPVGEYLVNKHKLSATGTGSVDDIIPDEEGSSRNYTMALCQLFIALALGIGLSKILALTGITFPVYFGPLITAALIRNISGYVAGHKGDDSGEWIHINEIIGIGNVCLYLFLGMAMSTLKLWELASLMLPLILILVAQATFMALYAIFVAFPSLGRNYDAAVLVSGICGFGLGATPNAMANMTAVCYKYHFTAAPFIIVPILGAMFVDLINTGVITGFLNVINSIF